MKPAAALQPQLRFSANALARLRATATSDSFRILWLVVEVTALLVLVAAILVFGNRHFGGFDQSVVVGAAYRFWEGQRPYSDFVMTVPVLFYLGAGIAFSIVGVSWFALIVATSAYAAATYWALLWGLKQLGVHRMWAVAVAFTAECLSMVLAAYWWYNPVTSITVVLFLVFSLLVMKSPHVFAGWVSWTVITALLALSKPNSAGLVIAGSALGFLLHGEARKKFLIFSFIALILDLLILLAFRLSPGDVFASYMGAAQRGYPSWDRFVQDAPPEMIGLSLLIILATVMPWVSAAFDRFTQFAFGCDSQKQTDGGRTLGTAEWLVMISGAIAAFIAFFTNGEMKAVDLPMLLVPVAISILLSKQAGWWRKCYLGILVTFLSLVGLTLGAQRYRVKLIGPGAFYQLPAWGDFGEYSPFFSHLSEGYNLHAVMAATSELVAISRNHIGPRPKVFFGPRMEFNYAVHQLDSPRGLPLFWQEGVGHPNHLRDRIVTAFRDADFDVCIFFRGDFTFMPIDILLHLESTYQRVDTHALTIFYRRDGLVPAGFDLTPRPIPASVRKILESHAAP